MAACGSVGLPWMVYPRAESCAPPWPTISCNCFRIWIAAFRSPHSINRHFPRNSLRRFQPLRMPSATAWRQPYSPRPPTRTSLGRLCAAISHGIPRGQRDGGGGGVAVPVQVDHHLLRPQSDGARPPRTGCAGWPGPVNPEIQICGGPNPLRSSNCRVISTRRPPRHTRTRRALQLNVMLAFFERIQRSLETAAARGQADQRAPDPSISATKSMNPASASSSAAASSSMAPAPSPKSTQVALIAIIHDPAHGIGANHQNLAAQARGNHGHGSGEAVHEAAAGRAQIETQCLPGSQRFLHNAGGGGKDGIGRDRACHHGIQAAGVDIPRMPVRF